MLKDKRFSVPFGISLLALTLASLLPYWLTRQAPGADGVQYAGFPLHFYHYGSLGALPPNAVVPQSFAGWKLAADILFGLITALFMGIAGFRLYRPAGELGLHWLLKSPWFWGACLSVAVAGGLILSVNSIMLKVLHSRPEVVVPKLEGKSIEEALVIISPLQLSIQQEAAEFDESLPAGIIVRQHPDFGMKVREGRAIRVVVSKGGQSVTVPDVRGKLLAEAQSALAGEGLQIGAVNDLFSTDTAKGFVLSQGVSSGTIVAKGALIDLIVSRGPTPEGALLVPDFTGQPYNAAQKWAESQQVTVVVKEDPSALGVAGTITAQDPIGGQPLLEGGRFRLTIVSRSAANLGMELTYEVPMAASALSVRIMARDDKGESKIYEGDQKPGMVMHIPVQITSPTRFRIYINEVLMDERVLEPK